MHGPFRKDHRSRSRVANGKAGIVPPPRLTSDRTGARAVKKRALITGTAIAALLAYVTNPSQAQDDGGLRVSLGVQQSFSYGDNLALGVPGSATNPEQGTTSLSTTAFALNLESITRVDTFRFQLGGSLRYGSTPVGTTIDTGFVDPFVALSYLREGARSRFSFALDIDESDVSLARPLWDFSDEDNVISPPRDLGDLTGTGIRRSQTAQLSFETGIDAPIGMRFTASRAGLRYRNVTSGGLTDSDRDTLGLSTFFRFRQATTGVVDLRWTRFDPRDGTPVSETQTVEVGFDHELPTEGRINARVGYTDGDPNNTGAAAGSTGVTGSLNYVHPLTNGQLTAAYTLRRTDSGQINTLEVGRSLDLPRGQLQFQIGATELSGGSAEPTGSLSWTHEMPTSQMTLRLNRTVASDIDNQSRFTTTLAAEYRKELTSLSSISANFSVFVQDGTAASNKVTRRDAALTYTHALTEDWNLDAGLSMRVRNEATVGRASSEQVFISLSRRFDLR